MSSVTPHDLALAARDYIRRALSFEIDGSIESLAFVDHYINQIGDVSDDVLSLTAAALGAYLGEIAISYLGGSWDAAGTPATWTVALSPAPIVFRPIGMAAEAIRGGEVAGYDGSISVPPELERFLAEALAACAPVDARYYYSLTGRLETLEHIVEILVDLRRQATQASEEESGTDAEELVVPPEHQAWPRGKRPSA